MAVAKPPYRTIAVLLSLAAFGLAAAFAHLETQTYAAYLDLLKVLGGAQSLKAIGEHLAASLVRNTAPPADRLAEKSLP